jgi:transcriptional regulator with XRE-family HTH domain
MMFNMSKVIELPDRSTVRARVAAEVRAEMGRAHISQLRLAKATGIAYATLHRRLNPKIERDAFTVEELHKIAEVLDVNVADFFEKERGYHPDGGGAGAPRETRTPDLRIIRPLVAA